jgi:NDP-sugar pyrophosphorylase family protein
MQAVVLAGGKGTRLKPYSTVIPKPLMPVGEMPILEIVLRQLKIAGFERVILAIGYLGAMFKAFFQDGDRLGLQITYSLEENPLGTAGPIALNLDGLDNDVLVMNGDLLTTLNYRRLFEYHRGKGAAATIATYRRDVKIDFGVVESENSRLSRYIEKPVFHYDVSMGVNVVNVPAARKHLVPGKYLDLPDLMMLLRNERQSVHCYQEDCYWLDIGRIDDYQTAVEIFESRKAEFLPSARR